MDIERKPELVRGVARAILAAIGLIVVPAGLMKLSSPSLLRIFVAILGLAAGLYALAGWPPRPGRIALITRAVRDEDMGVRVVAAFGAWFCAGTAVVLGLAHSALGCVYLVAWALLCAIYAASGWSPIDPLLKRLGSAPSDSPTFMHAEVPQQVAFRVLAGLLSAVMLGYGFAALIAGLGGSAWPALIFGSWFGAFAITGRTLPAYLMRIGAAKDDGEEAPGRSADEA